MNIENNETCKGSFISVKESISDTFVLWILVQFSSVTLTLTFLSLERKLKERQSLSEARVKSQIPRQVESIRVGFAQLIFVNFISRNDRAWP